LSQHLDGRPGYLAAVREFAVDVALDEMPTVDVPLDFLLQPAFWTE
jgi:hypothetical protein